MLSPPVAFALLGEVAVIPVPVPQMKTRGLATEWQENWESPNALFARELPIRDYLKEVRRI